MNLFINPKHIAVFTITSILVLLKKRGKLIFYLRVPVAYSYNNHTRAKDPA